MSDLLPPNATPQERALSLATDRVVAQPVRTLWNPYECPEGVLPWLAWALSVDEWDTQWSVDEKRAAIADSIDHHRKKGTVGALRRALAQLGYEVEIDEDTGEVYTFRLLYVIDSGSAGGALLDAALDKAQEIALRQKNARSELAGTVYLAKSPGIGGPFCASLTISGSETDVTDFSDTEGIWISGPITPAGARRFLFPCPTPGPYGQLAFSSDGTLPIVNLAEFDPPATGPWVVLSWISADAWVLHYFHDGEWIAAWAASDGSGTDPIHPNPWEAPDWFPAFGATGVPVLTYVPPP